MNELNYRELVKNFRYKPNVFFEVLKGADDFHWMLRITMYVEDSRAPLVPWDLWPESDWRSGYGELDVASNSFIRRERILSPSREVIRVTGTYTIPPYLPDEKALQWWMRDIVRALEDHETDEWLRYNGELLNDPHKGEMDEGRAGAASENRG